MNTPQSGTKSSNRAYIDEVYDRFEPVIGLEVHCQLKTASKLFCRCSTHFGDLPNVNTCPVCLALPGALPALNQEAVHFGIRLALAVGAEIHHESIFSRKQYFYPDLPKGYQISQYDKPYCTGGGIKISTEKTIRLTRIHMEEDAGKNVHGDQASYVDLNRAGVPLLEIVSEPDLRKPEEAAEYLKRLRSLVRHIDICDGNLEEGSFRCDANVSIRPRGQSKFGTRCEIKNLNSFKNIERAISYEIVRQAQIIEGGGKIVQSTMQFDAAKGITIAMRSKEESQDYRYFPEPDLGPLLIDKARIEQVKNAMPELPEVLSKRFVASYELSDYDASILTSDKDLANYFEQVVAVVKGRAGYKIVANWVISELLREVNARQWSLDHIPIKTQDFGELIGMIGAGTISGKIAKTVFEEMVEKGGSPEEIVKAKGLVQVSDKNVIVEAAQKVLSSHPEQVQEVLSGRDRVLGFLVGQVLKAGSGKYNPTLVNEIVRAEIAKLQK